MSVQRIGVCSVCARRDAHMCVRVSLCLFTLQIVDDAALVAAMLCDIRHKNPKSSLLNYGKKKQAKKYRARDENSRKENL